MKLIRFIPIALAGVSLLTGFVACRNDSEPDPPAPQATQAESTPLGDVLSKVIISHNKADGDSYILYDAASREFTVLNAEDYELFNAFASVIVHENVAKRAPKGDGWKIGGRGKGKVAAMKIAMNLATKLDENRDFEIHVEYLDDGSFIVWYRYVDR